MAQRLDWPTELRKIILDALDDYHIYAHEEGDALQKLRESNFIGLPEHIENSDDIAMEVYKALRSQIYALFEKAFRGFQEEKEILLKTSIEEMIEWGLDKVHDLFNKLVHGEISRDLFEKAFKKRYDQLRKLILEDYYRLFESYLKGHNYLINSIRDASSNLSGYLSIYYALKFLPAELWKKKKNEEECFIRFYSHYKIAGTPIQLFFCECISRGVNFLSGDYSCLDIFDYSKSLELEEDDFYSFCEYIRTGRKQLLSNITSHIVEKICSKEDFFKGRGKLLTSFYRRLLNNLRKYFTRSDKPLNVPIYELAEELKDLYNFLVLQNGILEYEIFRIAANSGYACLPKISVITVTKSDSGGSSYEEMEYEEREVDLLILGDHRLYLVEISFRKDIEKYHEKLDIVIDRIKDHVSGLYLEKCIVTKDEFEDFVNRLSERKL